jgi:Holliday junction resolvasome RuvABC endonuclease subunit
VRTPILVGLDIGFAHLGIVKAELMPQSIKILDAKVILTEKSDKKREVKAADDNIRRTAELASELYSWLDEEVVAICAESQSWPRNSSACSKLGMSWGVVTTLSVLEDIPIIQSSPQEIKLAVAGTKSASKLQVIEQRFPKMKWPTRSAHKEHVADATAAIISCLNHPVIIATKKLLREPVDAELDTGKESNVIRLLPR